MKYPKISIVTPSYNQGEFIEETILSVINQNYPNLEYIIIDGGSTDSTVEIIKKYEKHITYWVSEKDNGQTDAINKGFKKATGEIYGWLNSDDLLEKGALFKVAEFFNENPEAQVVYGNFRYIDKEGNIVKNVRETGFHKFLWVYGYNYIPQPSTFWRSELFHRVGGLDETYQCAMDAHLWMRFMQQTKIYHINSFLSRFRDYPDRKNIRLREISDKEDHKIREILLNRHISKFEFLIKHIIAKFARACLKFLILLKILISFRGKDKDEK